MTPEGAMAELIEWLNAGENGLVLIGNDELVTWPAGAVAAMKSHGLIDKASPAGSVVCPGCEEQCVMPVMKRMGPSGQTGMYVICDKRDDTSTVAIEPERLKMWRCRIENLCRFVGGQLGLRQANGRPAGSTIVSRIS